MLKFLKQFTPAIVPSLKGYNKQKFLKDLVAGIIVGVVALPLCIAFAIASGVEPEQGIITAIIAGFLTAIFGGSQIGVSGPTGAFIVVVYGVVQQYGTEGLAIATVIAGIFLLLMGLLKLGKFIKFIPFPIVVGFSSGIALTIFSSQIKDIFGLEIASLPGDFIGKWSMYFTHFHTINLYSVGVSIVTVLLIISIPKISKKIPALLVAVVIVTVVAFVMRNSFGINEIKTIGDSFNIEGQLPEVQKLNINAESINTLFSAGFTIAMLGAIVSLLSLTVADGVSGNRHNSNTELIGQGIANMVAPFFGAIPSTGAIARTLTNINNGGKTPVSTIVHCLVLLTILLFLGNLSSHVPLAALAGVLVVVSYNMSDWRTFKGLLRAPKGDVIVLLVTFFLTVIFNLTIAIEVGMLLAVVSFVKRINESCNIEIIKDQLDTTDHNDDIISDVETLELPDSVEVYEIDGPFSFGIANKFDETMASLGDKPKVRIIRMRKVPFIDSTGYHNLETLIKNCHKEGIIVILSGVKESVMDVLIKSGIDSIINRENILPTIHCSLEKANELLKKQNNKQK